MRNAVLGVVHRDNDSVELADPRHAAIVQSPSDADASALLTSTRSAPNVGWFAQCLVPLTNRAQAKPQDAERAINPPDPSVTETSLRPGDIVCSS
jgi:hypothetical protein